jgi:hypothetical protein
MMILSIELNVEGGSAWNVASVCLLYGQYNHSLYMIVHSNGKSVLLANISTFL